MAFNPELGSTSPAVLLDNAERLDKLVNGPAAAVPDRGGDSLKSWRLQQQEIANTLVNFQENGGATHGLPPLCLFHQNAEPLCFPR